MSRSGYIDECDDQWASIRWRGAVNSAIRGKRGQAFLRELLAALDAMPEKALVSGELEADGEFCALGVLGQSRGVNLGQVDTWDYTQLSEVFGISEALAREIMYENDEAVDDYDYVDVEICGPMRPHYPDWGRHTRSVRVAAPRVAERRWGRVRAWVASQIKDATV